MRPMDGISVQTLINLVYKARVFIYTPNELEFPNLHPKLKIVPSKFQLKHRLLYKDFIKTKIPGLRWTFEIYSIKYNIIGDTMFLCLFNMTQK